jgi:hypothetical protein
VQNVFCTFGWDLLFGLQSFLFFFFSCSLAGCFSFISDYNGMKEKSDWKKKKKKKNVNRIFYLWFEKLLNPPPPPTTTTTTTTTPWIFLSFLVDDANAKKQAMKVGGFPNLGQVYIIQTYKHTYIHTYDDDWFVSAVLLPLLQSSCCNKKAKVSQATKDKTQVAGQLET